MAARRGVRALPRFGLRQATLGVASDNPRAAQLYERAGMRVQFRVDSYERDVAG